MKTRQLLLVAIMACIWATTAYSAVPSASPDVILSGAHEAAPQVADKAFGDPTDFKAAAMAGANYLRYMQADFTEDNAGNGVVDADPDDGGFGWLTTAFENTGATYGNVWGVTINGLYRAYLIQPANDLWIAMRDAANGLAAAAPLTVTSAPNISFLLNFANLPEVIAGTDPLTLSSAAYKAAAVAIWDYDLANKPVAGNTSILDFGQWVIDNRQPSYPNGIIAWDMAFWVEALTGLHANFPADGYDALAASLADVSFNDSFPAVPGTGIFEPDGHSKGYTVDYTDPQFEMYVIGVSGLIRSFSASGTHTDKLTLLQARLLECQYSDGAFSYQWGAASDVNDRDYQGTAYAVAAVNATVSPTAATTQALLDGATWLAAVQWNTGVAETSGGFLYGNGNHVPEEGSECTAALAAAYTASAATITANPDLNLPDPSACGNTGDISFFYERSAATPGLFGYEMVVSIAGGLDPVLESDFTQFAPMDFFRVDDNLDGTFTVNATRYGTDPGLLVDDKLFAITVTTSSEVDVDVHVVSYRLRDPQNVPIFVDMVGTGFVIDCTAPDAVTNITADPRHNKVDVAWTHDGTDTIAFEVYRGLWYDTTPGVSAYPEYDDLAAGSKIPTRPVDYTDVTTSAEWAFAGSVSVVDPTNFTDVGWVSALVPTFDPNGADRGVYYYEVFAVDAAGNRSAIAPANDRATNYWLGDVATTGGVLIPDGEVGVPDIDKLGNAFATSDGDASGNYRNYIDVGPTDDWSAKGIPTTDNQIDFEDLMIFALNFNVVGPAKISVPVADVVDLAWTQREDGRWALVLVNGEGVQGVHVRAKLPVSSVELGDLVAGQSERPFLVNVGSELDVNLALLGQGVSFQGSGELFVVNSAADIKAADLTIELRAVDNSRLEFSLDKVNPSNTPMVFSLGANYPNPFNPMTKISFSLPEEQDVQLAVYSLDGRLVATLLNETRGPGQHDVVWMGRDDAGHVAASGIYFYRLDAGPYSQVRKMTLMK